MERVKKSCDDIRKKVEAILAAVSEGKCPLPPEEIQDLTDIIEEMIDDVNDEVFGQQQLDDTGPRSGNNSPSTGISDMKGSQASGSSGTGSGDGT